MSTTEASQIATRQANALNLLVAKNADKVVHRQYSDTTAPAVNWSTPVTNVRVTPDASVRSTPVTNVRFTPDPNLRSTPVASVLSDDNVRTTTNSNVRSTTNSHVRPAAAVSSSQEAWRRRCRQSTSPSSSARRAKAAFWERCTSPQRLPPPEHLPPDFRSTRSASSGRSTPTRFCSDADVASEPDVDRRRLSADWDSSKSDSGRGSYGRQQSCPSWITNSNESLNFHNSRKLESTASSESREHRANYNQTSTHESRSRTADSRFSSHEKENDSKWFSNHNSRSKTADNAFNAHEKEDAKWIRSQETRSGVDSHENQDKWIPSHETKSEINNSLFNSRENQDSKWVRSHETRSGVDDSRFNSYVKDDIKRIPSQETKSVIDDSLFNSQEKENTTRWATSHDLRSDTAHNQYGSNGKENNTKRLPNQETSFTHVDSSESKTQKEEEDLKWFSSQEVKYGYVDSEARTHFVEDSKWPPSSLDKRFEFVDSESKILHEKEQSEVNKKWSEMVQSNSTSKSSFHDEKFSSLPKNFERHKFENLFDSSETKKEIDKKVASETSSREDYSSQMCTREEKRQETQESYRLESSSHRTTSKKCLETEFEKSFEQFAKMMQTGEESLLFKKAEEIVLEDESKMLSEQMSENFKETERRFESYVKDLNATDNANVEKKFEKTVMEKSEEMSVTRSHTPAGFYDNHQEASGEMEEKKKVESDKTSDASRDAASTPNVEKRPRPASEFLDRQGLYDAFNRLRSSSPSDVNETLFRICDVLQTDARTSIETGRQQSQISGGGNSPSATAYHDSTVPAPPPPPPPMMSQGGAPPPPPPPPPLGLVHIPNMRLKTEIADVRKEPPAAIQNAMMTKDKKPFTYTPGGLDLSEIRSPRMARRINRNAHAEDAAAAADPPRPAAQPRPLSMPPQPMAVPVFPPPPPPPPPAAPQQQWTPPAPQQQWTPPPPAPQQQWTPPPPPQMMAVPKLQPVQQRQAPSPVQQNTGSIYVPPVQPVQSPRSQLGSLYVPPVNNNNNGNRSPIQQQQDSPSPQLNKSPAPWMTRNSPQQQQAKEVPPWVVVNRDTPSSPDAPPQPPPPAYNNNNYGSAQSQTRIIPIQIEGRETAQSSNTRIIPIQMEGSPSPQHSAHAPQFNYQQQQQQQPQQQSHHQLQQRRPVYVHNKNNPQYANAANENSAVDGRSPQGWVGQPDDSAPVQSRSFKVLQKVTDAYSPSEDMPYNSQGVPLSQLRKLQLSDDDRALMNKVKTQVSDSIIAPVDEENPRYRGGYIPSRVFKALDESVPQGSGSPSVLSNRRPQPQEPTPLQPPQPYIPPSEQQVQEPRKYQGGAIPSRSFRILQAMTAGSNPSGRPDESEY